MTPYTDDHGLEDFWVTEKNENQTSIDLTMVPKKANRACNKCGSLYTYVKENRTLHYRDVHYKGKFCGLQIKHTRYQCKDCGTTFRQGFSDLCDSHKLTTRLEKEIFNGCDIMPFETISKRYSINKTTVASVFNEHAERLEKSYILKTPRVLGLDECHLARKARVVLVDNYPEDKSKAKLLEMGENTKLDTVKRLLEKFKDPDKIEVVTIDMTRGYKSAVEEVLPNAKIVIDKFHVIQTIIKASGSTYSKVREELERSWDNLSSEERKENLNSLKRIKLSVHLFRKNVEDLTSTDRSRLAAAVKMCPEFGKIIAIKEEFRRMYFPIHSRDEAERLFEGWIESIPADSNYDAFKDCGKMIKRWYDDIFNYFDYPYTNAATEAKNGVLKAINRAGKGYSFPVIRKKALFQSQKQESPKYERPVLFYLVTCSEKPEQGMLLADLGKYASELERAMEIFELEMKDTQFEN